MNQVERILENLNKQQIQAVTTTEGYIRVIAGAGSGKTKALTSRYAYLVETLGINPGNILCVTFTNKSANEMRNRVRRLVGDENDYGYITTYHGFCVKVLREDINKIQYPRQFVIMDVEDQKTVLRDVYEKIGINSKDLSHKQALKHIERLKGTTNYIEYISEKKDIVNESGEKLISSKFLHDIVFLEYIEKQQRNFALDFNDLINFTVFIFDKNNDVLEKWQKRLCYIQVDETQDSSTKQFYLVDILSRYHKNLFVVGDPDQTIYEWRGAKPELLVNFDKNYPNTQTVIMNQNYRSTPNILNLGNYIIKNNKVRINKDMFTNNSSGVDVVHYHAKNDFDEGMFVVSEIQKLIKENQLNYSDFAILYRANHISRVIEQSFIKEQIPYSIWGGIRFFERREIKDILSYLRLIIFGDDLSFMRIFNTPSRKLGKVWLAEIKRLADKNKTSLFETIENNPLNRQRAIEFVNLIKEFRKLKDEVMVSDLVKEILVKTGLTEVYRSDGDEERIENIKELQNSIISLENDDLEKLTLENYLQEIALYTDIDVDDEKLDRVKLMTIHTAKGLEFPYVFLCGFTDGVLPSYMSMKEKRLEEERRLTYVAITRAEKAFYITESEGFNFQTGMNKYPSRFLWEIKDNLYVRKGILSQSIIDSAKKGIEYDNEISHPQPITILEVGDNIEFFTWGEGIVISKDDEEKVYIIKFSNLNRERPIRYDWRGIKKIVKDEYTVKDENNTDNKTIITDEVENKVANNIENISTKVQDFEEVKEKDKKILSKIKRIFRKRD